MAINPPIGAPGPGALRTSAPAAPQPAPGHPGLGGVVGQGVPGGAPPLPVAAVLGGNQPAAPAIVNSLEGLARKSDPVYADLPPALQQKLDARLANASPQDKEAVRDLLHFAWHSRGATTKESRLAIRTALASFVAHGGGLAEARSLKAELKGKSPQQIRAFLGDMKSAGSPPLGALSKHLLDRTVPEASRTFARVKDVLTSFPVDAAAAGKTALVDDNVTIARDATGKLQIANKAITFGSLATLAAAQPLTATQVQSLRTLFDTTAQQKYSTQGLALDFVGAFRAENKARNDRGEAELTMSQFFQTWNPDGRGAAARYDRGDCMCHAEVLLAAIRNLGVTPQLIGMNNKSLTEIPDPAGGPGKVQIPGAEHASRGITHTDVLIPYTDEHGNAKALLMAPGAGPGLNYLREYDLDAHGAPIIPANEQGANHPFLSERRIGEASVGMDAAATQKAQFAFRHNLQLVNTPPGLPASHRNLAGIDLLAGKIYLNGNATRQLVAQHGMLLPGMTTAAQSLSFDFKAALRDRHAEVTVQVWNPTTGSYQPETMTNLKSFVLFLKGLQAQFGQPEEFVRNTAYLAIYRDQYIDQMLTPSLKTLAAVQDLGKNAAQAAPSDTDKAKGDHTTKMKTAATALAEGRTADARAAYTAAEVATPYHTATKLLATLTAGTPAHGAVAAKLREADTAIAAGDRAAAATHLKDATKLALGAKGIDPPATMSAVAVRALGEVAIHSPVLAGRIVTLALAEAAGTAKAGITDYVATIAMSDQFMADLSSGLDPMTLPTRSQLGFEPKFHVTLDAARFDEAKAYLGRLQADGLLPDVEIDDATRTLHIGYTYQAIFDIAGGCTTLDRGDGTIQYRDAQLLKMVIDGARRNTQVFEHGLGWEHSFGNPRYQAERQQTRFEAVRDLYQTYAGHDFSAHDARFDKPTLDALEATLKTASDADRIRELLTTRNFPGFVIGEEHPDLPSKAFISSNMAELKAAGVRVIGIEHLKIAEFSGMLDDYMNAPPGAPMGADLAAALKKVDRRAVGHGSITAIVEEARRIGGMRLVGLDTDNNNKQTDLVHRHEIRAGAMNMVGKKALDAALRPGEKFVLLAGRAHNQTHVGLDRGVPGFSQMYGIPEVRLDPNGTGGFDMTIDREDPTKRTRATAARPY